MISDIQKLARDATRYHDLLKILARYGIVIPDQDFYQDRNGKAGKLVFSEYVREKLQDRKEKHRTEIRDLNDEIHELRKQIPKPKEITLGDGSTMHVFEND